MKNTGKNVSRSAQKKPSSKAIQPAKVTPKRAINGATSRTSNKSEKALHSVDQLLDLDPRLMENLEHEPQSLPLSSSLSSPELGNSLSDHPKPESIVRETEFSLQKTSSRFERSLERASRGEAGPIKIDDLKLDEKLVKNAHESRLTDYYRKLFIANPDAQPGRPLVNVKGHSDDDLEFQLLTLFELVIAAKQTGRSVIQVSLVRISDEEADGILKNTAKAEGVIENQPIKPLTLSEIADLNGFFELNIKEIERDQNIRYQININSHEFRNLKESIRSIGLQNPPVVEVRQVREGEDPHLVCISGHRRLLALEALGVEKVVCALKKFQSSRHRTLAGLAENINREDLHFLDKAAGYGQLVSVGMTTAEIAVLLDGDVRTIGKYVRASEWEDAIKQRVRKLGSKITVRYLLNTMAAGERTPKELHGMLDRIEFPNTQTATKEIQGKSVNYESKLLEFCELMRLTQDQRGLIQKAMKYLGVIK